MSLEANKEVIKSLFSALERGKVDEAVAKISPDVDWWVIGMGKQSRDALAGIWGGVFGNPGPKQMKVLSMTAEADRVGAEIESDIPLPDGRNYRNSFHILYTIKDGKIVRAREYFDTAYTQAMFGKPPA